MASQRSLPRGLKAPPKRPLPWGLTVVFEPPNTTVRPGVYFKKKIIVHFHTQYMHCTRIRVSKTSWNENSDIR